MKDWDHQPPTPSDLGDHEVPREGDELHGIRIALLVTGGIAAYTTPTLARSLRRRGAVVQAFCSSEALRYVTAEVLEWATTLPCVTALTRPVFSAPPDGEFCTCAGSFDIRTVSSECLAVDGLSLVAVSVAADLPGCGCVSGSLPGSSNVLA